MTEVLSGCPADVAVAQQPDHHRETVECCGDLSQCAEKVLKGKGFQLCHLRAIQLVVDPGSV